MGAVGRAGVSGVFWTLLCSALCYDLQQQHLDQLRQLYCLQVPVHGADDTSYVSK